MEEYRAERAIAERYLDEMLEAERLRDFKAWSKRWDTNDLGDLDDKVFQSDLDAMNQKLGAYKSRAYFGVLKGHRDVSQEKKTSMSLQFVWRMIYEKSEALSIVGIRQREGIWHPYKNVCHL